MAESKPSASTADATAAALQTTADVLTSVVNRLDAQQPIKIPIQNARIPSPWNPEGKKASERTRFKRPTFQNGRQLFESTLTEQEIDLFNRLKPGRYGPDRRFVVIVRANDRAVQLRYPCKTLEERMENSAYAAGEGIAGILKKLVAEAEDRKANPAKWDRLDNGTDD